MCVRQLLEDDGSKIVDSVRLKETEKGEDGFKVILGENTTESAIRLICALGRSANIETLSLDAVGVTTHQGKIVVDEYQRTELKNVFAVDDCTDTMMLTPVAIAEGKSAVKTMFGEPHKIDYRWVPSAVGGLYAP